MAIFPAAAFLDAGEISAAPSGQTSGGEDFLGWRDILEAGRCLQRRVGIHYDTVLSFCCGAGNIPIAAAGENFWSFMPLMVSAGVWSISQHGQTHDAC